MAKVLISSAGVQSHVGIPAYAAAAVRIGTAFPASPATGDRWVLVDSLSAPTWRWQFVYNGSSSSSYKWECIGGPPFVAVVQTDESTTSGTLANLTTAGPELASTPYAGDWQISWGASQTNDSTTWCAPCNGAGTSNIAASGAMAVTLTPTATSWAGAEAHDNIVSLAAAANIRIKYVAGAGTSHFVNRWMSLLPLRFG